MLSYWRDLVKPNRIYGITTSGFVVTGVASVKTMQGTELAEKLSPTFVLGRIIRSADKDLRMMTGLCYTAENGQIMIGELSSPELIEYAIEFARGMDDKDRELFVTPMRFYEIQAIFRL